MTSETVSQARDLLIAAAAKANEAGVHVVKFEMATRSIAFSTRQCCYAAKRTFLRQIRRQAETEGKSPDKWLRESLLDGVQGEFSHIPPATWPNASILYRHVNGKHYLVFEFRRIASDPLWSKIIENKMTPGAPEEERVNVEQIVEKFK